MEKKGYKPVRVSDEAYEEAKRRKEAVMQILLPEPESENVSLEEKVTANLAIYFVGKWIAGLDKESWKVLDEIFGWMYARQDAK